MIVQRPPQFPCMDASDDISSITSSLLELGVKNPSSPPNEACDDMSKLPCGIGLQRDNSDKTTSTPSSSKGSDLKPQNGISVSSPLPLSVSRLWRTSAQRNLRNQWSKLASYRQKWASFSANGRSHATSIVNACLSQRYVPTMELGALSDMPGIREKASRKFFKQQELYKSKLLSSYRNLVDVVCHMVNTSKLMRCYLKGTSGSTLVQFSSFSENDNDPGDGGGIPVFGFWEIAIFEKVAEELVHMFILELNLKRLLVVEILSTNSEVAPVHSLNWSDEVYPGEFDDLYLCNLYSKETCTLQHPRLDGYEANEPATSSNQQPKHEILQVYLVTWLAEVNINTCRLDDIFALAGVEMHVSLS